jgi:hypothetical protein
MTFRRFTPIDEIRFAPPERIDEPETRTIAGARYEWITEREGRPQGLWYAWRRVSAPPRGAPRPAASRMPRAAAPARPREHRSRSHAHRGPPSDDDPHDDDPPAGLSQPARAEVAGSGHSDLTIVWCEAMARFETVDEFLELADLALRRTEWLLEVGWGRRGA